jgi:beta-mannosidase
MNDCLSLPLRQGSGGIRRLEGFESLWMPLGEGESVGLPAGRGSGWEPAEVPGQRLAIEGRSSLWYRCKFARPDHSGRVMLRVGGAFLAANVWLNGRLLGSHYGYFAPFGFDITSFLAADNLLVICCESPIETDLTRKKHVMGIFNDGDSRPYPPSAYFSLPEPYRWEVPVGLWRGVELEYLGPVALDWLRLRPRLEAGDVGVVEAEARLRNLDGRDMSGEISFEVIPEGGRPLRLVREYRIPGGLELTVPFGLTVPQPRRWSPWRIGEATLHQAVATVTVSGRESVRVSEDFGFRDVQVRPRSEGWEVRVNGSPFFLRGACYQPELRLDRLTQETMQADLALARETNLDALRVHGHVLPEEFYRLADRAGMLVFADLPLTGAYAYHATPEEGRFFEASVREQVPELVELLRNRPSIALWTAHDDPPWIAANASLADVHSIRQNYSIDQEARGLFEKLDPSRPALAGSGDLDSQVRAGWGGGGWPELAELEPRFVSGYGAQALPSAGSPVWDDLGRSWPVADDDPAWLYAGFQPFAWTESGVGLPSDHESLAAYIEAGQAYQAWLLRYATDQFRMRKFEPCWGAFAYQLVDPFPAIGFGVVDHARHPKAALAALRQAMAPTRLIIEPLGFEAVPGGLRYPPGKAVEARLVVVNDDFDASGPARVRWSLHRERAPDRSGMAFVRDALVRKSFSGSIDFELPAAVEPAVQVAKLSLPVGGEGVYRLSAELVLGSRIADATELDVEVSAAPTPERRRRALPGYLAERLVDGESLRTDTRGLSIELLNRTRPAALTAVHGLTLDGDPIDLQHVLAEISGRTLPLPKRLELPVGRRVRLLVDLGAPLRVGRHTLELDLTVAGVASGRLRVEGFVAPEELRPAGAPRPS